MLKDDLAILARGGRVLIVGDSMLDSYLTGTVGRISPEAPVPVLLHEHDHEVPGGAANVAMNVASLGGNARLVGLVGQDLAGERLEQSLSAQGIGVALVHDPARATIRKIRVLAGAHQLLRIDHEQQTPPAPAIEDELLDRIREGLTDCDVMVVSDYGKGCLSERVLQRAIAMAREAGVFILVDPKRSDFRAYAGADVIKPNRSELARATGIELIDDEAEARAAEAVRALTGASVLLTRSEKGMAFFGPDGGALRLATQAKEVFDVSGAGDTAAASFALAMAAGLGIAKAIRLANIASGIVVGKLGTATVGLAEILEAQRQSEQADTFDPGALASWDEAKAQRERWRAQGLSVGFTNGCFDLLHPGHIAILKGAAAFCDRLIVALNADSSVSRLKGPQRPIQSELARAAVLGGIRSVDLVVLFEQDTPLELIRHLVPDVLVKGADYTEEQIVGADIVKAAGGRVERIRLVEGQSTSNLVARSSPAPKAS